MEERGVSYPDAHAAVLEKDPDLRDRYLTETSPTYRDLRLADGGGR